MVSARCWRAAAASSGVEAVRRAVSGAQMRAVMTRRIVIGIVVAAALAFGVLPAGQAPKAGVTQVPRSGQHVLACGGVLMGGDPC